jgi:hypothetical protein
VLVAALVALAGCSGDGGNGTTDPADTDAPTDDLETTADDGMETTDDDGMETTDDDGVETTDDDGVETTDDDGMETTTEDDSSDGGDGDALFNAHTEALRNAGSFTAEGALESTTPQGNTSATILVLLNMGDEVGYQEVNISSDQFSLSLATFTRGDETFQRTTGFGEPQYSYETEPYSGNVQPVNFSSSNTDSLFSGDTDISWSESGSSTVDGVSTTRYTASGTDDVGDADAIVGANVSSVEELELNAYVDGDGVIRRLTIDFAGENQNGERITQSLTYDITDVGSTTVPEPDWLDEARNSSN